jgi:hypothetical protein
MATRLKFNEPNYSAYYYEGWSILLTEVVHS